LDAGILDRWGARDFDGRTRREHTIYEHWCDSAAVSSDNGEHTIVVNVWSKSEPREPEPVKMSSTFAAAGLNAAFKMELTERKIENSIRRGFPLGEFWIQNDLAEVDDALKLAALSVANDADQQALQEL
jgi:hypothetical protein